MSEPASEEEGTNHASNRTVALVGTKVDVLTRVRMAVWAPGVETGAHEVDGHLRLNRTFELDVWVPGFVITAVGPGRQLSIRRVDDVGGEHRIIPSTSVRASHVTAGEATSGFPHRAEAGVDHDCGASRSSYDDRGTTTAKSFGVVSGVHSVYDPAIEAAMARHPTRRSRRRDFGPDGRICAPFRPFAVGSWPWWTWS